MLKRISGSVPTHVTILLIPDFSLIAFTSIVEPMRNANRLNGKPIYTWEIASHSGDPVVSSSNIEISADTDISSIIRPSNVVICSGVNAHLYHDTVVFSYLRRWAIEGAHIGAVCTGSHILAHAGLLINYDCTIHWENIDSFIEQFPNTTVSPKLFTVDRDRFTCAGGTSGIDMMLKDIAMHHGKELANSVSEQFMHERIRDADDNQSLPLQSRLRINHPKLIKAISRMEENTEEPLSREEVARQVNLSHRQLERLFRKYLGNSPAKYYLTLRLKRAKVLLLQTSMPITEVAFASGFTSASHFSKCYKDVFFISPREERRGTSPKMNLSLKDEISETFEKTLEESIDMKELHMLP